MKLWNALFLLLNRKSMGNQKINNNTNKIKASYQKLKDREELFTCNESSGKLENQARSETSAESRMGSQ